MVRLAVSVVASVPSRQVSPAPRGDTTLVQPPDTLSRSSLATGQHISPRLKLCAQAPASDNNTAPCRVLCFMTPLLLTHQVPGYSCCIIVLFIHAMVVLVAYHGIIVLVLLCSQTLALVSQNVSCFTALLRRMQVLASR